MKPTAFYKLRIKKYLEPTSDEKIEGMLEQVFGVHLPKVQSPAIAEEQVEGFLENVFGIKLPDENAAPTGFTAGRKEVIPTVE